MGDSNNIKKVSVSFIFLIFLIGFISAACPSGEGYLGNKDINSCIRISQTCASCSYVNISSITFSTSNETLISNVAMNDFGNGEWDYQFCNTSNFGNYYVAGVGDVDNIDTSFKSCFDIGQNLNEGESGIYILFVSILFLLLLIMIFFIFALPSGNEKDEDDMFTVRILKMKYVRIFLIAMCYPLIIIIINLMNGLATQFSTLSIFAGTLGFIFLIMMKGAWIWTLIIILWIFYKLIQDSNIEKNLDKLYRY